MFFSDHNRSRLRRQPRAKSPAAIGKVTHALGLLLKRHRQEIGKGGGSGKQAKVRSLVVLAVKD